ncbi:ubiquinone biosynthesis O-methyltransferase [Alphaproteobacteria bacterium]|nr:ubiquinone biosynthesis O-methyltransferase [Alphaproteobacteria bacterium]
MSSTIDNQEISKFEKMANEWWNPSGKFKPLHKFNPIRLSFMRSKICQHFNLDDKSLQPLTNLKILDIGCGGGLISEPFYNMGGDVLAIDASPINIEIAKTHAQKNNLKIKYLANSAEDLAQTNQQFDVVLALEIIEHVSDIELFIKSCGQLVKPNGLLFIATINRTVKSLIMAKIGAEYVLRWLPIGTHQYDKFVKPSEIFSIANNHHLKLIELTGFSYNLLKDDFYLSQDLAVNYCAILEKTA